MTDNYESKILTTAVNKHLDVIISMDRNCLNQLQNNCDELVYYIVSEIYKESGHKISFESVLDIIKFRIEELSNNLDNLEKINRLDQKRKVLNKKLEEERKRLEQKKISAKTNLEIKIFVGFLIAVITTSSIASAISNHYESKNIKYRNSIIKTDTNSNYKSKTTDSSCRDKALREFEANHGSTVDNEYELTAMRLIILKHCGY